LLVARQLTTNGTNAKDGNMRDIGLGNIVTLLGGDVGVVVGKVGALGEEVTGGARVNTNVVGV
jgi:hypothetical protein